ncbi:MAG: hypothetical protein R3B49_03675 [Phycisphaerales bacterium]
MRPSWLSVPAPSKSPPAAIWSLRRLTTTGSVVSSRAVPPALMISPVPASVGLLGSS